MPASKAAPARKRKAPASISRADEDAYFNALSDAVEERQRNEPHAKRLERANRQQYESQVLGWYAQERGRRNSPAGNRKRTTKAESRRENIVILWPEACAQHPVNLDKRYEWLVEHLHLIADADEGVVRKTRRGFNEDELRNRDLPKVRKKFPHIFASK